MKALLEEEAATPICAEFTTDDIVKEMKEITEEKEEEESPDDDEQATQLPKRKDVMSYLKSIRDVLDLKGLDTVYSQFYDLEKAISESYACEKKAN